MVRRTRLDAELVRRGQARSREHACLLIEQRRVTVSGTVATKPATAVSTATAVVVLDPPTGRDYVSRGGHKLASALDAFMPRGLVVQGRLALDAGASTGGFTDVLLGHGARLVVAVDVGYGQLAWSLQRDDRVHVLDRTNVRDLRRDMLPAPPDLVVADLSFISLTMVLPRLVEVAAADGDFVVMVKPQFEVGREQLGKGGVVRDRDLRVDAVMKVAEAALNCGLSVSAVSASALPGPAGNVEYFLWLRPGAVPADRLQVERVVLEGPQ